MHILCRCSVCVPCVKVMSPDSRVQHVTSAQPPLSQAQQPLSQPISVVASHARPPSVHVCDMRNHVARVDKVDLWTLLVFVSGMLLLFLGYVAGEHLMQAPQRPLHITHTHTEWISTRWCGQGEISRLGLDWKAVDQYQ